MSSVKLSNRDAKWDNVKCFMIICVVTGHVLYRYLDTSQLARGMYLFIYTFHMPIFIFVSGMFSKRMIKEQQYEKILYYLLIYFVMKYMEAMAKCLSTGEMKVRLFWEDGPGWYAFAMAFYLLVSILIGKYLKDLWAWKLLVLTLILGILWGYDDHLGDHFCSARICNFYPFFIMGYILEPSFVKKRMGPKILKIVSLIVILMIGYVCLTQTNSIYWILKVLKGKYAFSKIGITALEGISIKLIYYILTAVVCFAVMSLVPQKDGVWSYIGRRTLPVFIFHTPILILLLDVFNGKEKLLNIWPLHYVQGSILLAWLVVIFCILDPFVKIAECLQMLTTLENKFEEEKEQ